MKMTEGNRAILILVFIIVAFNGIFLSVNGLFMLVAPLMWYDFVPGVTDTGFFNQHFQRRDLNNGVINFTQIRLGALA
jgi:hypothetical protein